MTADHIDVCICTYKRPQRLLATLQSLKDQMTDGLFTWSIVVVDNDRSGSAKTTVSSFSSETPIPVEYDIEPVQNIALARNRALDKCGGSLVAFIDDDEQAGKGWLLTLFNCLHSYRTDGALGPVLPAYEKEPPGWVVKGGIFSRSRHETGTLLHWSDTRTGNALVKRSLFAGEEDRFQAEFGRGGEDRDFFRRMIGKGKRFVWCDEAPVYETIPEIRWGKRFLLSRALLRGQESSGHPNFKSRYIIKSAISVLIYTFLLSWIWIFGFHIFMEYCIKSCDHIGLLLGSIGIKPVKVNYIMESTE